MKRNVVLEWRTFNLWSRQILEINKDLLNEAVLDKFRVECTLDDIYSDDICWLEDIVRSVNPEAADGDLEGKLTSRLKKYYSAVRAFHAGNSRDVSSLL